MNTQVRGILKHSNLNSNTNINTNNTNSSNNQKKVNFTNETLKYIARLDAKTRLAKYKLNLY